MISNIFRMEPDIFSKEFNIVLSLFRDSIYVNLQRYATCIMELHACLHLDISVCKQDEIKKMLLLIPKRVTF